MDGLNKKNASLNIDKSTVYDYRGQSKINDVKATLLPIVKTPMIPCGLIKAVSCI